MAERHKQKCPKCGSATNIRFDFVPNTQVWRYREWELEPNVITRVNSKKQLIQECKKRDLTATGFM